MRIFVVLLAALTVQANERFCSPSGEFCVAMLHFRDAPSRAAAYRAWPSGNADLLYEFTPEFANPLVTDDGFVVTRAPVRCDKNAELLTIRALDGTIARTIKVTDVFTRHDQLWLCRGDNEVRWSAERSLRATVLVTETNWDDLRSLFTTIEIDPATGEVDPPPEDDYCPDAVRIEMEPNAFLPPAIHREMPEYPEVAIKARIKGIVRARLVIGSSGAVESVTIVKPLPFGLDEAVRTALLRWTFAPQPEPFTGEVGFRFEVLRPPRVTTVTCYF